MPALTPGLALTPKPALTKGTPVAVVGAGTMGAGIAQVAAAAGNPVKLHDSQPGSVDRALERIGASLQRRVDRQRMTAAQRRAILARLTGSETLDDLRGAGLVIEAIVEDLIIKQQLFARLEDIVGAGTILATNTSSLSITAIAAGLRDPSRCIGMHFFNPAPAMPLVEIISGLATSRAAAETAHATAESWGKSPVHARSTPGFIVNRIARPFYGEALRILQEDGADAATIDTVMRDAGGFRMGPFELIDLIGLDVNYAVTSSVYAAFHNDPRYTPSLVQKELVDAGHLGHKSGHGFYEHGGGAAPADPALAAPEPPPNEITVRGNLGVADPLVDAIENKGIKVARRPGNGEIRIGDVIVAVTDGQSATARSATEGTPLVLLDLARDYAAAQTLAIAPADQCAPQHVGAVVGLLQAAGKQVAVIDDVPGLILMRTLAMLTNEAAAAVHTGVAAPADIDTAMRLGMNFPTGPFAWAETIGLSNILRVVANLAATYGEDRYRPSPLLLRKALAGTRFLN